CKQGERYVPPGIPRTLEQIRPPPRAWQGAHIQLHLPLVRIPGSVHPALDHTPARGQWASCGRQTIQYQERDQARERNQTGPGGEDPDGQEPGRYADEATCQGSTLSRGWPGSLPHEPHRTDGSQEQSNGNQSHIVCQRCWYKGNAPRHQSRANKPEQGTSDETTSPQACRGAKARTSE